MVTTYYQYSYMRDRYVVRTIAADRVVGEFYYLDETLDFMKEIENVGNVSQTVCRGGTEDY